MKTYYEIALDDLEDILERLENKSKRYNQLSISCQQASEKFLKHIIQEFALTKELLTSNNLESLAKEIKNNIEVANITDQQWQIILTDARYLKSFYYDARYPGDNYVEVEEWQVEKCLQITQSIKDIVDYILSNKEQFKVNIFT